MSQIEYRPLLTAAEVVAALRAGDVVEVGSDNVGWYPTVHSDENADADGIGWTLSKGYRYRARPAGEPDDFVRLWHGGRSAGEGCKCGLRTKLVGDGCAVCNPEYAADPARTYTKVEAAEIEALRANHEELVRQFHAMEDERNAAEARAARLEELLRAMRVAAEAMPEYLPRIQKCRPAKSGFMAYMGQKAETCQGEEYGYVHKGRVIEILNRAALGPGGGA